MKKILFQFSLLLLFSCSSNQEVRFESDREKMEHYFEKLFDQKVSATVYIVHPEVCETCTNEFLVKIANQKSDTAFYILSTRQFQGKDEVNRIKQRIRYVYVSDISRKGLSSTSSQKIILKNGKIQSVEILEL